MTTFAWTLVHFVWQGALIGAAALVVIRTAGLAASARYAAGIVALCAMLAAPLLTFAVIAARTPADRAATGDVTAAPPPASVASASALPVAAVAGPSPGASAIPRVTSIDRYLPFVFAAWISGVALLSLRLGVRWWMARRLAHRARPLSMMDIESMARRLAGRLAVDRVVQLLESADVAVPVVVGWVKPVVILPAAALAGLTPAHVEALLAHELAHVRRHDYLVNLLQSVAETLLFYHPAVWLVSREVRIAREHCCDDIAVGVCDRLEYVTALTRLATMATHPPMALAATDGPLVSRVRRLLGPAPAQPAASSGWAIAAVGVMLVTGVPATLAVGRGQEPVAAPLTARASVPAETQTETKPVTVATVVTTTAAPATRAVGAAPVTTLVTTSARRTQENAAAQEAQAVKAQREAEAQKLREGLAAIEQDLENLRRQQAELEQQKVLRDGDARIEALKSDVVRTQATLAETRRKFEAGLLGSDSVRAAEADLAKLQKEMAFAERQREFDAMSFKLQMDAAMKSGEYDRLKEQYEAAQMRAESELMFKKMAEADPETRLKEMGYQRTGAVAKEVLITASGGTPLRLVPAPQPYTSGGPSVGTHGTAATAGTTKDGRVISGFKFLAWQEDGGARVMVLAAVPRIGEKNVFTADPKLTELVDFATYLIPVGKTLTVEGAGERAITIAVR